MNSTRSTCTIKVEITLIEKLVVKNHVKSNMKRDAKKEIKNDVYNYVNKDVKKDDKTLSRIGTVFGLAYIKVLSYDSLVNAYQKLIETFLN